MSATRSRTSASSPAPAPAEPVDVPEAAAAAAEETAAAPAAKTKVKGRAPGKANGKAKANPARAKAKMRARKAGAVAGAEKASDGAAATGAPKSGKQQLVRDSFTIPKNEYHALDQLKKRAMALEHEVRKGELLRAGLQALAAMPDKAFLKALQAVPTLKTGRPKGGAKAAGDAGESAED